MSITKTPFTNRKAIILLFSDNSYDVVMQQRLNNCCTRNNLEIIRTIQTTCDYDPNIFHQLITIINEHDQPITIVINEYSYATYSQVITCCVLATIAMANIASICTYWEATESKELKLHFNKDPFNLLLVAEEFLSQLLSVAIKNLASNKNYKNGRGK